MTGVLSSCKRFDFEITTFARTRSMGRRGDDKYNPMVKSQNGFFLHITIGKPENINAKYKRKE